MSYIIDKQRNIFVKLFLLSNRLQTLGDKFLAPYGLTTMQWLLTLAIAQQEGRPITLMGAAKLMNTSHQNISSIAKRLKSKGYVLIEKDLRDLRTTRLRLTEKTYLFWENGEIRIKALLEELFNGLENKDIDLIYEFINKLYGKIVLDERK